MTASKDRSSFVASGASAASMLRTGPVFASRFRVWGRVLRAFDSMLVQPLKTRMRLEREVSELRGMDYRELQDIGINRMDIDAIRAGTYRRTSSDNAERILFRPEAGKPVTQAGLSNLSHPQADAARKLQPRFKS